jgi:hypothetical protein
MVATVEELIAGAPGKARAEDVLEALAVLIPRGRTSAVKASFLAGRLGVSERTVRALVDELIDRGYLIGSSCGQTPGYFTVADREDLDVAIGNLRPRVRSLVNRWKRLEASALERFGTESLRLFELDGVG